MYTAVQMIRIRHSPASTKLVIYTYLPYFENQSENALKHVFVGNFF